MEISKELANGIRRYEAEAAARMSDDPSPTRITSAHYVEWDRSTRRAGRYLVLERFGAWSGAICQHLWPDTAIVVGSTDSPRGAKQIAGRLRKSSPGARYDVVEREAVTVDSDGT